LFKWPSGRLQDSCRVRDNSSIFNGIRLSVFLITLVLADFLAPESGMAAVPIQAGKCCAD
jgi:hypothetical protein